jgi:LuxR family maltose regulon positive regulatory protein
MPNEAVAHTLVIAPGTVKKHLDNIYGKLGVHNRTEAVARARQLDLL